MKTRLRAGSVLLVALTAAGLAIGPAASAAPIAPLAPAPAPAQEVPVAPLPPTAPVAPDVEKEALRPAAPSPDSGNAAQASSPDPLKLVAVTWTGPRPDVVELRSKLPTGLFGPWTRIDTVDSERDGRGGARGTEPVWVDDAREVQVRAVDDGAPATQRMSLTSIDPSVSTNDAVIATGAATGSPAAPKVVTRAQWGADEKLMTWKPEYTPTVRAVGIHHTAGTNNYTAAESAGIVRGIYAYHAKTLGWGDIGYSALVDRFGTVFEGRAGGLDRSVTAAHAGGFNRETFGIAMMGDYTAVAPPGQQIEATSRLAAYKLGGLYRDPKATVSLTSTGGGTSKYPAGKAVTLPTIFAHRDVGATECPGNTGVKSMPTIRDRTAALVGDLAKNPIRAKWLTQRSTLGEPSVVEAAAANSGRTTRFAGGAIYWTARTKAWAVRGALLDTWTRQGAERSSYGYPVSDQYSVRGGLRQDFERGSLFYDTATKAVRKA